MPLISLYTPWKYQKTSGILMFSEIIKRDQWHGMDQQKTSGLLRMLLLNLFCSILQFFASTCWSSEATRLFARVETIDRRMFYKCANNSKGGSSKYNLVNDNVWLEKGKDLSYNSDLVSNSRKYHLSWNIFQIVFVMFCGLN